MVRRAILLSGSLGLGHEMMVRSCADLLSGCGWEVRSRDSMAMLGGRCGRAGQVLFTRAVQRAPGLYDALHFAHLRTGSALATAMDRRANGRLVPALRDELVRWPADLVLSVFATGASAAAQLKPEAPGRRTVVLCTDVTLHRLWVSEGTDLFVTTSPAARASVLRYLPRAKVAVIPPPVRPEFAAAPTREEARRALALPADRPCVLVIDSGWGFGPMLEGIEGLARSGVEVLAVAGRRKILEDRLRGLAGRVRGVHPFGFVDEVPTLMAAADVVTALPGATTCGEARSLGRPLLLLDLMPGHGRDNLLHELELGGARVAGRRPEDLVESALALLEDRPATPRPVPPGAWRAAFAEALQGVGLDVSAEPPAVVLGESVEPTPAPTPTPTPTRAPTPAGAPTRAGAGDGTRARVLSGASGTGTGSAPPPAPPPGSPPPAAPPAAREREPERSPR